VCGVILFPRIHLDDKMHRLQAEPWSWSGLAAPLSIAVTY
jgi:hypothetical protein